jgi:SNF2 family DNA or RNA helicase
MSSSSLLSRFKWFVGKAGIDFKEHQFQGLEWCIARENSLCGHPGGIVADEMGLGKTITMISLFLLNFVPRTLVIVPPALLSQWASEIYRTTGHRAIMYHGLNKKQISLKQLDSSVIVLATYAAVSQSRDGYLGLLHKVRWGRVVFDEAHHLRNRGCGLNGARLLKARCRWFITGTPIQNSANDFSNLCSALRLPSDMPSEEVVSTYMLRRTKKQIGISIPDVIFKKESVSWPTARAKELAEGVHDGSLLGGNKLLQILRSRQVCILPSMLSKFNPEFAKMGASKMDAVVSLLFERRGNGNGKLVFCHFREEIDELVARLVGFKVGTYDGRTRSSNRSDLGKGCDILILQIQTGCEGLNLQKDFSEVYFVSPHWNPAVEDQAVARCHRIGQKKEVFVFRFTMGSYKANDGETIDSYISYIQDLKREVSDSILDG